MGFDLGDDLVSTRRSGFAWLRDTDIVRTAAFGRYAETCYHTSLSRIQPRSSDLDPSQQIRKRRPYFVMPRMKSRSGRS